LGLEDNKDRKVFEKVSENVVAVSCGECHTMYITQEGHLYASGRNYYGELGLGDNTGRTVFKKNETY
jgi:alpha-tubulin suppressor-like RCC1 family protein